MGRGTAEHAENAEGGWGKAEKLKSRNAEIADRLCGAG